MSNRLLNVRLSGALLALALFTPGAVFSQVKEKKGPGELVRQLNDAYVNVFEQVSPSVVVIEIEKPADERKPSPYDLFGITPPAGSEDPATVLSEGSGIICRADGYIYTNSHVVEGTGKITVKLKDGRSLPAKVVGADAFSDVAVIRVEAKDLPVAEFANSDEVRVGQIACVIGAPFNFTYSFTTGVISAKGRNKVMDMKWSGQFEDFLQTDASINPGNSGGPLLDIDGRVIGMNTLIQGFNRGLGFAISSNMLRKVGEELIAKGKISRPWIGIGIRSIKDQPKKNGAFGDLEAGVVVQAITSGTPAFRSDLRPSDVILKVDEVPVAEAADLQREVQKKKIGQTLQLAVWRGGKQLTIPVVTAEMPADANTFAQRDEAPGDEPDSDEPPVTTPDGNPADQPPAGQRGTLGIEVQVLTPELASARQSKAQKGLIVTEVVPASEAAVAGVKVGDIITEINGKPVSDEASFTAAVSDQSKKSTLLFVERETGSAYLVLKSAE